MMVLTRYSRDEAYVVVSILLFPMAVNALPPSPCRRYMLVNMSDGARRATHVHLRAKRRRAFAVTALLYSNAVLSSPSDMLTSLPSLFVGDDKKQQQTAYYCMAHTRITGAVLRRAIDDCCIL